MTERRTLRQISVAHMVAETPPPDIDSAEAVAARDRGRAFLREAAASMRRRTAEIADTARFPC